MLDTIQQFVTEIDFWRVQALHYQELAHRIPSNYFTLPSDKDKDKGLNIDKSLERDRERSMSQGREEEKEPSGGTTTAMAPLSSSSAASAATAAMLTIKIDTNDGGELGVMEVAESKTHSPFSSTPSHLPLHAPVPSMNAPHARRQELALALVSSPVSQQSHQYAAAQLAAKSLEDALEVHSTYLTSFQ